MVLPVARLVLVEEHIQHPIQPTHDAPVFPHNGIEVVPQESSAQQMVACLDAGLSRIPSGQLSCPPPPGPTIDGVLRGAKPCRR